MKRSPSQTACGCPDYIENNGMRFNASEYGYPFFLYNGIVYFAPIHSGHRKYAPTLAAQLGIDVSELTENVRHKHTTGRIYPKMAAFGGKTVVTVWCDNEKSADTLRLIGESTASHFSVDWDDLLFVNRKGIMTIE